jgi:hypothetical protein
MEHYSTTLNNLTDLTLLDLEHSESGLMMLLHSVVIGVILYLFMFFVLKQEHSKAEARSILLAAVILIYMILFGHSLPKQINKNILS